MTEQMEQPPVHLRGSDGEDGQDMDFRKVLRVPAWIGSPIVAQSPPHETFHRTLSRFSKHVSRRCAMVPVRHPLAHRRSFVEIDGGSGLKDSDRLSQRSESLPSEDLAEVVMHQRLYLVGFEEMPLPASVCPDA